MSALERLQGIQDKFTKAVDPSAYIKAKPQAAPGSAAPRIKVNQPRMGRLPLPSAPALRGLGIYDLTQAQTPKSQFISGMTITNPIMGTALNAMDGIQDLVS